MEDGKLVYSGIYSVDIRLYNILLLWFIIQLSLVRYDFNKKVWEARKDNNPDFVAVTKSWLGLGSQEWIIYNDSKVIFLSLNINSYLKKLLLQLCSQDASYKRNLTLSVCSRQEFTCSSGECITMAERCDRRHDCEERFGQNVYEKTKAQDI